MKKFKNISLWIVLALYIVAVLGFVAENRNRVVCNGVEIEVSNAEVNHFLKKEEVKKTLDNFHIKMVGTPIDSVNTFLAEKVINKNPAVEKSAAYTTVDGKLRVQVIQRRPILRVINKHLQQYYVDENAQIVPLLRQYSAFTLVANGNIDEPFEVTSSRNIYPSKHDTILLPNIIYDIFRLAKYIDADDFWKAQIEQIYVNSHRDIELIPRVGAHVIIFGKGDDIDMKFRKLKSIYKIFNQIGWNNYKTINLKYKDQVVCTKR